MLRAVLGSSLKCQLLKRPLMRLSGQRRFMKRLLASIPATGTKLSMKQPPMRDNILVRELTCACETRVSGRAVPIQPKRKGSRRMNGLSTKRVIPQKPSKQVCHFRPAFCQNRTTRPRRPQPCRLRGYCISKQGNRIYVCKKRLLGLMPHSKSSRPVPGAFFGGAPSWALIFIRGRGGRRKIFLRRGTHRRCAYKSIKFFSKMNLATQKAIEEKTLTDWQYKTYEYQIIDRQDPRVSDFLYFSPNLFPASELDKMVENYVQNGLYKAMVGSEEFAESFRTSEWLYYSLKDLKHFDYTAVISGYLKSV